MFIENETTGEVAVEVRIGMSETGTVGGIEITVTEAGASVLAQIITGTGVEVGMMMNIAV